MASGLAWARAGTPKPLAPAHHNVCTSRRQRPHVQRSRQPRARRSINLEQEHLFSQREKREMKRGVDGAARNTRGRSKRQPPQQSWSTPTNGQAPAAAPRRFFPPTPATNDLPTQNCADPWTEEEDAVLREGVLRFGTGDWSNARAAVRRRAVLSRPGPGPAPAAAAAGLLQVPHRRLRPRHAEQRPGDAERRHGQLINVYS